MPITGSQKALMYCQSATARCGATRSGYHSSKVFVSIGGTQYATGRAVGLAQVDDGSLTITDVIDQTPHTCQMTARGFVPANGQEVIITLGSKNTLVREFGGIILSHDASYLDAPANAFYPLRCIDYSWLAAQRKVSGQYTNVSATVIAQALVPAGFTGVNIQAGLPTIDTFSYSNLTPNAVLTQLATRIGAYWFWDYQKDLHFFTTADTTYFSNPTSLTSAHVSLTAFTATTDLSQIVTRCYCEGGGVTAAAACVVGDLTIPVGSVGWYAAGGGTVATGQQRVTYTGLIVGGAGSLVGPGVTPASPPTAALTGGTGLGLGAYNYAFTFVTGAGESLPSPIATITTEVIATPATAPTLAAHNDGFGYSVGFAVGDTIAFGYCYAPDNTLSFLTPISPSSAVLTCVQEPGGVAGSVQSFTLSIPLATDLNVKYIHLFYSKNGSAFFYDQAILNSPHSGSYFIGSVFQLVTFTATAFPATNPNLKAVNLTGIAVGPATTTQRKVYRTAVGATQLKLLATIANNTATTLATDTAADGTLGANAPVGDTSGLAQPTGQITVGSTTLLLASPAAFSSTGGWAIAGAQFIRYTGISGNSLTGIPASGSGSITAPITYNVTVTVAPALSGIPASGVGALLYPILQGDKLNLLVQVDDLTAQATLSALVDPSNLLGGAAGIQEDYLTDGTVGLVEATARASAQITLRKNVDTKLVYQVRDRNSRSGRAIVVSLPSPFAAYNGTYTITQVDFTGFTPGLFPTYTVQASSVRFSFEDLLRRAGG